MSLLLHVVEWCIVEEPVAVEKVLVMVLPQDGSVVLVVVGEEGLLLRSEFWIDRCNWIPFEDLGGAIEVSAAIRYNHPGAAATVEPAEDGRAVVRLHEPQRAVTPGQACVFYQDDLVVGGGWIMRH